MSFKNKTWANYRHRKGEMIEIAIHDGQGQKIGYFQCVNQKDYAKATKVIEDKFGYIPYYKEDEINKLNIKSEIEEEKKELNEIKKRNWLDKDLEW